MVAQATHEQARIRQMKKKKNNDSSTLHNAHELKHEIRNIYCFYYKYLKKLFRDCFLSLSFLSFLSFPLPFFHPPATGLSNPVKGFQGPLKARTTYVAANVVRFCERYL